MSEISALPASPSVPTEQTVRPVVAAPHTRGLRRGYVSNLRVDWDRKGKGGYSTITLLNSKKRPVAVLLGDYVPGEIDPDMEAAARLFASAPDVLAALLAAVVSLEELAAAWPQDSLPAGRVCVRMANAINNGNAAIAKATGQ